MKEAKELSENGGGEVTYHFDIITRIYKPFNLILSKIKKVEKSHILQYHLKQILQGRESLIMTWECKKSFGV